MTVLFGLAGVVAVLAVAILKALAVDEVRGRVQRRITARVEETISSLPAALQDEWAEEWRAELAASISMPLAAFGFARGVRASAATLSGERAPAFPRGLKTPDRPWSVLRVLRLVIGVASCAVGVATIVGATDSGPARVALIVAVGSGLVVEWLDSPRRRRWSRSRAS